MAEAVGETWESPWPPGVGVEARGFLRASGAMAWQQGSQQGLQCRGPPARVWAVPTQWGLGPGSPSPSGPLSTQGTQTGPRRGLPQPKHELQEGQLIGLPAPSPMGLPFTLSVSGVREGVDGTGRGHSCTETPLLNRLLGEPGPTSDSEGPAPERAPRGQGCVPSDPGFLEIGPPRPALTLSPLRLQAAQVCECGSPEGAAPLRTPSSSRPGAQGKAEKGSELPSLC